MNQRDSRKALRHALIARRDRAGGRDDARWLDVNGPVPFTGEIEPRVRREIEIDLALLIEVHRVRARDTHVEPVAQHPAVPVEIRTHTARRLIVRIDERHPGLRAREYTRPRTIRALARHTRRIDAIALPVRKRRRVADTR